MSWTDERVTKLILMWNEGQSPSQIASVLGSVSRNAVIGKAHRLGLQSRVARQSTRRPSRRQKIEFWNDARIELLKLMWIDGLSITEISQQMAAVPVHQVIEKLVAMGFAEGEITPSSKNPLYENIANDVRFFLKKSILPDITAVESSMTSKDSCKWSLSESGAEPMLFCGLKTKGDTPFCAYHLARALVPYSTH